MYSLEEKFPNLDRFFNHKGKNNDVREGMRHFHFLGYDFTQIEASDPVNVMKPPYLSFALSYKMTKEYSMGIDVLTELANPESIFSVVFRVQFSALFGYVLHLHGVEFVDANTALISFTGIGNYNFVTNINRKKYNYKIRSAVDFYIKERLIDIISEGDAKLGMLPEDTEIEENTVSYLDNPRIIIESSSAYGTEEEKIKEYCEIFARYKPDGNLIIPKDADPKNCGFIRIHNIIIPDSAYKRLPVRLNVGAPVVKLENDEEDLCETTIVVDYNDENLAILGEYPALMDYDDPSEKIKAKYGDFYINLHYVWLKQDTIAQWTYGEGGWILTIASDAAILWNMNISEKEDDFVAEYAFCSKSIGVHTCESNLISASIDFIDSRNKFKVGFNFDTGFDSPGLHMLEVNSRGLLTSWTDRLNGNITGLWLNPYSTNFYLDSHTNINVPSGLVTILTEVNQTSNEDGTSLEYMIGSKSLYLGKDRKDAIEYAKNKDSFVDRYNIFYPIKIGPAVIVYKGQYNSPNNQKNIIALVNITASQNQKSSYSGMNSLTAYEAILVSDLVYPHIVISEKVRSIGICDKVFLLYDPDVTIL